MKIRLTIIITFVLLLPILAQNDERVNSYPKTNSWGWRNSYSPQTNTAPTIGKGMDLTDHLKSLGFSQEIIDSMSKDINGVPRPRGKWDIGAYQMPMKFGYTNNIPNPPSNLRVIQ